MQYRKHFIPLESNPELFTSLIHRLGVSKTLAFHDVMSLDDSQLLAFIPRPVYALILVFPTSTTYESELAEKDKDKAEYIQSGDEETVVWYRQTINNACGLYGILHSVSNGGARALIGG
jgi:ubiquitin carboxyl-terminal hydrolase L3